MIFLKRIFISIFIILLPLTLSSCFLPEKEADPSTFNNYTKDLFYLIMGDDELTNHFLFKNPESFGLNTYSSIVLPTPGTTNALGKLLINNFFGDLDNYDYYKLDFDQKMTHNILTDLLSNINSETKEMSYLDNNFLGSYLGYQAQLPLLLSEYDFDDINDIYNYFAFIDLIPETFISYLEFEKEKASIGYGMPDFVITKVINQCTELIEDIDNHFLIKTFPNRIENLDFLTEETTTKNELIALNKEKITGPLKDGYAYLKDNLDDLYGKAKNNLGLYYYNEGKDYYSRLFKQETGYDIPIPDAINYIENKLETSFNALKELISANPDLYDKLENNQLMNITPEEQIKEFQEAIVGHFPPINYPNINIKYIDKSMENHFSPAAYINSPIDDFTNEYIFLNNASIDNDFNYLYHTLAHEGVPGHLYQNIYFKQQDVNIIRKVLKSSGYTEGWATYTEMYMLDIYEGENKIISEYLKLNDEVNGALQCRLDMGIHYEGWDANKVLEYLNSYFKGYTIENAQAILEQLIEIPTNSQIYFFTYFKLIDMRNKVQNALKDNFIIEDFHKLILDCGPVPLRYIETVVDEYIKNYQ